MPSSSASCEASTSKRLPAKLTSSAAAVPLVSIVSHGCGSFTAKASLSPRAGRSPSTMARVTTKLNNCLNASHPPPLILVDCMSYFPFSSCTTRDVAQLIKRSCMRRSRDIVTPPSTASMNHDSQRLRIRLSHASFSYPHSALVPFPDDETSAHHDQTSVVQLRSPTGTLIPHFDVLDFGPHYPHLAHFVSTHRTSCH